MTPWQYGQMLCLLRDIILFLKTNDQHFLDQCIDRINLEARREHNLHWSTKET